MSISILSIFKTKNKVIHIINDFETYLMLWQQRSLCICQWLSSTKIFSLAVISSYENQKLYYVRSDYFQVSLSVTLSYAFLQVCLVPCSTCERAFHMGCQQPPLERKAKSQWRCTYCLEPHDKPPPPPPPLASEPSPPAATLLHKTPRRSKELRNQRYLIIYECESNILFFLFRHERKTSNL